MEYCDGNRKRPVILKSGDLLRSIALVSTGRGFIAALISAACGSYARSLRLPFVGRLVIPSPPPCSQPAVDHQRPRSKSWRAIALSEAGESVPSRSYSGWFFAAGSAAGGSLRVASALVFAAWSGSVGSQKGAHKQEMSRG